MIDSNESIGSKLIKKGFWLYLFSFLTAPLGYIIKISVSGEISASDMWVLYWVISLITILASYNDFWVTESLKYFLPKFLWEERKDKIKWVLFLALIVQSITSILLLLFFWFWSEWLSINYFKSPLAEDVIKTYSFFFIFVAIFGIIKTFFEAIQNTFISRWIEFLRMIGYLSFTLLFIFLDLASLKNFALSAVLGLIISTILLVIIFIPKYKENFRWIELYKDRDFLKKVLKYGLLVFIWSQAWVLLSQVDMQLIIYLVWTEGAWYYTNYVSIMTIPFMILWPIFGFLLPLFASLNNENGKEKMVKLKEILFKYFSVLAVASGIFFFVFGKQIAFTLFWEKFIPSWEIIIYSSLFLVFNFLLQINFGLLWGVWKIHKRVKILFIALIFNTIMDIILVETIWIWWAALATGMGWLLIFILSEIEARKEFKIFFDYIFFIKNLIIIVFLGILFALLWIENTSRLMNLLMLIWYWWILGFVLIIANFKDVKWFISEIKRLKSAK